jgi:hypothetical protein
MVSLWFLINYLIFIRTVGYNSEHKNALEAMGLREIRTREARRDD